MITFTFSALLEPVFGARPVAADGVADALTPAQHQQAGFQPLLAGILPALVPAFMLEETGPALRKT